MTQYKARPFFIYALIFLFVVGTIASFITAVSLSLPGSFLEPIWHLNPQAHGVFSRLGSWAIVLMGVVCAACASTAIGLWRRRTWGYWLALGMLSANLAGDAVNVISGSEPRAIVGIPIVLFMLAYLTRHRIRELFH